jgi:AbrB family looped-hinge helix DNA binding protein
MLSTTKMTSKGQVVIPEEIRKRLKLDAGARFVVVGEKDVVILKTIAEPPIDDFEGLIDRARQQGKQADLTRSDIAATIKNVRRRT